LRIAKAPRAMLAANSRACTAPQAGVAGAGGPDARGPGSGERAPAPRSGDEQQVKGCSARGRAGQDCLYDRAPQITTGSPKRRTEIVGPEGPGAYVVSMPVVLPSKHNTCCLQCL